MDKPKMALFDYGHTLIAELGYSHLAGMKAVMERCLKNPHGLTAEELEGEAEKIRLLTSEAARSLGVDVPFLSWMKLLCESFSLEFSLSPLEMEQVFWDGAGPAQKMPYVEGALDFLRGAGVRMGVVSNIGYSEAALRERILRLLPEAPFEFFLSSSEYAIRKPSALLYRLACAKAGLSAGQCWFVGDHAVGDVEGPSSYGMFPVWYQDKTIENPFPSDASIVPSCPCLHISDWREFAPLALSLWTA
jgi:putative hydrolase of the HAD superfamily